MCILIDSCLKKFLTSCTIHPVASSRRSVSQGAVPKTAREKIKKSVARGSERTPVGKLNKRSSGVPGSGIPSDWSILTDFVNTQALLRQMRYTIWRR